MVVVKNVVKYIGNSGMHVENGTRLECRMQDDRMAGRPKNLKAQMLKINTND